MPQFNIGDHVQVQPNDHYNITSGWQTGYIIRQAEDFYSEDSYYIRWDHNQPANRLSRYLGQFLSEHWLIKESVLQLYQQDPKDAARTPVLKRINRLWNNSNYVKNNPQLVY